MANQPPKKKGKITLHSFFKPTPNDNQQFQPNDNQHSPQNDNQQSQPNDNQQSPQNDNQQSQPSDNQQSLPIPSFDIERDPGKRKKICDYPLDKRDEIRRAYLIVGPYQPKLQDYKVRMYKDRGRRFQYSWFSQFSWLEYSPSTHKAYCFPCFVFANDGQQTSSSALVTTGFDNWKRVQGKECAFLGHVGSSSSSPHNRCMTSAQALMRTSQHIDKVMHRVSKEEVLKNRLRLKTTIMTVSYLALQGCSFRGHDESESSSNRGNVIEMIKCFGEINEVVKNVVLRNAPKNAQYTSGEIQKELLAIMANRVRQMIREEIGDAYFSLLVDEAQDESHKEQMAIILRFVNASGILTERFFAIRAVSETSSQTLKNHILDVLGQYNLQVHKLRGQGYDGASNMRGQWNGLQALFLKDCPYAYYVHCFAHRLQLTLVAAAKQCDPIWDFFSLLDNVINIVKSSPKRSTELQAIQRELIENMVAAGERDTGRGANQMMTLQRSGSTRWGSHYESIKSMIEMYDATCKVLDDLLGNCSNPKTRAELRGACKNIKSFDFVFSLHVMNSIMGITNFLCQAFQKESVDILAAIRYVSTAKNLLRELREQGWEKLLQEVKDFCSRHDITILDMDSNVGRGRSQITIEHHYHFDVFNEAIDFQLTELDTRFNETSVRLLTLSVALDPKNSFQSFNANDIYELAVEFYPEDFERQERHALLSELKFYSDDVVRDPQFEVPTLAKLSEKLVETRRSEDYKMITRLIRLVLTLPVSTATTERAFSAMKHVKTAIRSKMGDEFLADRMTIYVERDLMEKIDIDSIIEEFAAVKDRRAQLSLANFRS